MMERDVYILKGNSPKMKKAQDLRPEPPLWKTPNNFADTKVRTLFCFNKCC